MGGISLVSFGACADRAALSRNAMTEPKTKGTPLRVDILDELLDRPVEDEAAILEALTAALAKGQPHDALWQKLQDAAMRDDRTMELAFAFEKVLGDRRMKLFPTAAQAGALLHAARYFTDRIGDADGARGHLEKALALQPSNAEAAELLEVVLVQLGDRAGLSQLLANSAAHKSDPGEQLDLLRRAMKLLDGIEGQDERAIKIGLAVLKLEPGHAPTIAALEQRLGNAGKWADLAKLLEQSLAGSRGEEVTESTLTAHRRLVEIYATKTSEIERATPHVEVVLEHDPADELAVSVAEKLLGSRASAGRVAAALEKAYEALDDDAGVARMLALQLEQNRGGPKRLEVQKRLATLHATRLGDPAAAWPILEQVVIADPADGAMRKLLRQSADLLNKQQDAAKLLQRASSLARDPLAKALVAVEAARLVAALGDSRRAAQQIAQVLETSTDPVAQLEAARALAELIEGVTASQLATALERVADHSEDREEREEAAERLATVAEFELEDLTRAIEAWRRLLGAEGERGAAAREALERLFEATDRHHDLVESLKARAADMEDPLIARALLLRAARVLEIGAADAAGAAAILREIGERFGPARDLHDRMMPLLVALNAHAELASVLEKEIELATDPERPQLLVELGRVRLAELGDLRGALESYRRAIEIDPSHEVARESLEAMLDTEIGLEAAIVLEPIYRSFGDDAGLVRALEARLAASVHRDERATLLADLVELCEPTEQGRALSFASAALALELDRRPPEEDEVERWLTAADRIAGTGPGPGALAAELASALGDGSFTGAPAARVARRAAEAHEAAGRVEAAVAMAQRAVAAAPDDVEGEILLDRLLAGRGDAAGRLAAREEAVVRAGGGKRRRDALLHLARVAEEIGEPTRAADAFERVWSENEGDRDAIAGLLRVYEGANEWDKLGGALERARELETEGEPRRKVERRLADARVKAGRLDEAVALFQKLVETDDGLPDVSLGAAFALAARANRPELAASVLERRVLRARDDAEASRYAEVLGELLRDKVGDTARAAEAFRTAARAALEEARSEAMWTRVVAIAADDREAAERLTELRSAAGDWAGALAASEMVLRLARDDDEATRVVLGMEEIAAQAGAVDTFLSAAEATLERPGVAQRTDLAFVVALARARALVGVPERADEASSALRGLVTSAPDHAARTRAVAELGRFVEGRLDDPRRWDDARAWFDAGVELAEGEARKEVLVLWARAEAQSFGDLARAIALADRVIEEFPDDRDARALRAEWLLATGDVERGVEALLELRVDAEGDARATFERRAAALLLGRGKAAQAVELLESRLSDDPTDGEALALALHAASTPEAAEAAGGLVERVSAGLEPARRAQQLEALLAAAPTSPRRRAWLEDLLACVEGERAAQVAVRLAEEAPEEDELWDGAEQRARDLGSAEGIGAAYRRVLEALAARAAADEAIDVDAAERLGRRAVDWQEEWFQDEDAAGALLLATLRAVPGAMWAFERLKLAYNAAERWDDLFDLYDLVLARTEDPQERVMLLDDAAQAARDFAQDGDRAIRYLEQLAKLRPDDTRVASSLERLYERYGRWRDLIAMLSTRLDVIGGREGAKLAARVATMWLDGAKDGDSALAAIERLERFDAESAEVLPLLERVAALPVAPEPGSDVPGGDESAQQRAAARLEDRYRTAGRSADLARMLEIRLLATSGAARVRRLRELVALRRDQLGDDDAAAAGLIELVRLEPTDAEHRAALVAIAERTGRWDRLADALESIAADTTEAARLALLAEAARLHEDRAGSPERAAALWRTILDEATTLGEAGREDARAAAERLDALLESLGDAAGRCAVLEQRAQLETSRALRAEALQEAARVAQVELGDLARAVDLARRRMDLVGGAADPLALGAIDVVVEGLRALGRWEELVEALAARARVATAPAAARADRVEAASVLVRELGRGDDAIAAWKAIEAAHGRDDEVAEALAGLYAAGRREEDLAALLEDEAARSKDPRRAATLLVRLGDLRRQQEGYEDALASYRLALETDPACEPASDGLRALVSAPTLDRAVLRDVVGALVTSYQSGEAWEALVALSSARIGVAEDEAAQVKILVETAKILENRLFDASGAAEKTADALVLDPSQVTAADELLRLSRAAEDFRAAARVLGGGGEARLLARVGDEVAVELLRGAASSAEAAGEDGAAERFVLAALSRAPGDVDLLERLVRARRVAAGSPLVDALERLALATSRLDVWRDAVEIARDAGDPRARALTRSLLELAGKAWTADPGDDAARDAAGWAFEVLVDLARDAGDDVEVRAAHLRAAELPYAPERKRELAMAAAGHAPDAEAADILGRLFQGDATDDEVATALDQVLRRLGRRADLRAMWTQRAEVAMVDAERVAHRRELAELALEDDDRPAALATLRRNVEEAADAESFSRLVEVLAAAGQNAELCAALEEHAARTARRGDAGSAAKLWERAAEVAETHLRALERAIQAREKSLGLADSRTGREGLVRLLEQRGHWGRAAKSLEMLLGDALADEGEALTVRLVDALARSGDVARAQHILESAAAASDPGSPLRARLVAFYRQADLPRPLAELLREAAEASSDPSEQVALLREAAALHIQRLDDANGALPLLARAAELDPDDQGVRLVLAEAMRAAGRYEEATSVLQGLLAKYGNRRPKERALVHFELSKLALSAGDRSRALEELDQAAKIDPAHPEILHAAATLALEEGQLLRAQRTFRGLLFVLKPGRPEARTGRGPSRSEVLFELAEIEAKNKDVARQSEMVESAFEAAEADPWEAERLLGRLRSAGRADLLARALRARLTADLEPAVAAQLVAELAETLSQSGEVSEAIESALRAAKLAPRDEAVHRRVAKVLRQHDALPKYRAWLEAALDPDTEPDLEGILFAARALERELGDDLAAAAALRRADEVLDGQELSEENATHRLAVSRSLEEIALRGGDTPALLDLLERRLEPPIDAVVDEAERVGTLRRILALRLEAGADEDTIAGVSERLVAADEDPEAVDADLRRASDARPESSRLARLLEDFARERSRVPSLVAALIRLASIEPSAAADLLREASEVASDAGDDAEALRALELAVAAAPGADDPAGEARFAWAFLELAERRRQGGDLAAAADLWERAARVAEGDDARELTLKAARTAEESLGDPRRAAGLYQSLREREPADRAVWGPLASCLRKLGERDALVALLEETLPLVDDRDPRNQIREELAGMLRATDPSRAAVLLEEVLDEDPSRWDAAADLETMLSSPERQSELAAFLSRRLDAARDAEDKARVVDIAQRLGAIYEQLGEDQEAATAYHAGLEWDPDHRAILRKLVDLAAKRDDQMELTDALENLMRVETGPAVVDVARSLASVRESQGDEPGAHAALLSALRATPDDKQLFAELKARFEQRGDARSLAEALAIAGQGSTDPAERKRSLLEAATALREQAGDLAASVELLNQAFEMDPTDRDVLFQLMDSRSALGQHAQAITAVEKAMAADPDGDPWLFFSRAVLREGLGDGDGALTDLQLAHDRSGGQYVAELEAQIRTCLLRAEESFDNDAGKLHRARLARLLLAQNDIDGAAVVLEELLQQDSRDVEALQLQGDLLEKLGRWAEAADTWRQLFALQEGTGQRDVALRFADASVRADRAQDARGALERALSLDPASKPVRDRLRALYDMLGDRLALAQLEFVEADQVTDPVQRAGCLVRGGRILLEMGEAAESVLAAAEQASQLVPGDQDVSLLHAEALARVGRRPEAAAVLDRAIAAHKGRRSPKLAQLHRAMGRMALESNDAPRALDALGKAFDCDPQNAPLALELGALAVQLNELEIAGRAYRSVTLMRAAAPAITGRPSVPPPGGGRPSTPVTEGASSQDKSVAYYQLGCIAYAQRDMRRAKLMLEKALDEDPAFTAAREMLGGL